MVMMTMMMMMVRNHLYKSVSCSRGYSGVAGLCVAVATASKLLYRVVITSLGMLG